MIDFITHTRALAPAMKAAIELSAEGISVEHIKTSAMPALLLALVDKYSGQIEYISICVSALNVSCSDEDLEFYLSVFAGDDPATSLWRRAATGDYVAHALARSKFD